MIELQNFTNFSATATVEGQSPTIATLNSDFLKLAHLLFEASQSLQHFEHKSNFGNMSYHPKKFSLFYACVRSRTHLHVVTQKCLRLYRDGVRNFIL